MSQMSIEEEKVPGDFARLAARGEPEVADQQDAPADDAFVRRAAPRAARRAAQPKPVSDEDLLSGMNDDPEQLAITKANARQRQEEFWKGVGGGAQGTSHSAPTGDAQGRMGVAGPRSLDLWQEGDPGPVAGNARAAAPRSLAQTIQDRKFEASLYRPAVPEQQVRVLGKAGSRSKFMDNASGVLDWAAKGVGLAKEADDTAGLYGKDIPEVLDAAGEQFEGLRGGMDATLEQYSRLQAGAQRVGGWTDAANKVLNPIPKVTLGQVGGKDIKLGVGTKEILSAASGAMQIAQFHKNEDADPNATAIPEQEAVDTGQTEYRRALEARRRAGRLFEKANDRVKTPDGGTLMTSESLPDVHVRNLLAAEKKRANLVAMQKAMRLALRAQDLGKAQEKSGVRSLNEYSMEKTAYLNDKEFVPKKPLGFSDDANADAWSPEKGMIKDGKVEKDWHNVEAGQSVYARYAKQGAVKGQELPAGLMPGMQDSAQLEALDDGYRDDIEGGRSKQKQVAPARFLGGAGQLFEGKLDTKRMVRDGRYKTAYAAKAAELGVLTGTKTGAAAAQAGLIAATGGVAAPLIAAAEAGKHLAFHAKEQLGVGMQSASRGLEKVIDPKGLAKEQDNRDLYNKHFGLRKPEAAPDVAGEPVNDAADQAPVTQPAANWLVPEPPTALPQSESYDEVQQIMSKKHEYFGMNPAEFQAVQAQRGVPVEQAAPEVQPEVQPEVRGEAQQEAPVEQAEPEAKAPHRSAPTYEEMTADPSDRAKEIRQRGIIWEPQRSAAVMGPQKRTMARAAKDLVWGGVKKVAKGLWSGLKGIATVPYHLAQWGWKGAKAVGGGLAAAGRGIASLFSRKKAAEPGNKAREALKAMEQHTEKYKDTAVLDRPQLKVDRLKDLDDLGDLSDEEKVRFRELRQQHAEVYGERDEFGDEPGRVGGSRQAAKEALMAKPEVKRAEERAALREQMAPGKHTPRMASGEILDILRGRAKADLEAEAKGPGDGGDGGGGSGDLLDQINALKDDDGGAPHRPDRSAASVAGDGPKPDRPKPQVSKEPGSQASGLGKARVGDGSGDVIEQIDTSAGKGDSLPAPVGDPLDAQSAAFDAAFGSSARENYYLLNERAKPGSHLQAAAAGHFPVRRPGAFDPHRAEAEAVRRKADLEGELAGLPQGDDADMADATALRAHRARQEDHDRRLEEFERSDPGAFESAGQDRMRAWDAANPRPVRPETTHDKRVRLQGEIAALRDPKDIVAQKWSAHRADVDSYRRRQQYLGTYAPGSKQIDPDLQGFERAHQVNAQAVDSYRQGGAAPSQEAGQPGPGPVMNQLVNGQWQRGAEEEKAVRPEGGPPQPKAPARVEAPAEQPAGRPLSGGPLLGPDQAQGIRTLDRGGGAVDIDLGRAMNSTPRLERNARGYWGNTDYDPKTDSPEFARDDLFIEEAKDRAVDAIRAGQRAGADAEAYRAKFASIKKRHAGGFLNPKNWDRTRARREDKLRSRIQQDYPATPATSSPQAMPEAAPSTVVSDAADKAPAIATSRHRTAMPAKSALRSRDGQKAARVPAKLMAEAEERVTAAFEQEEKASQPFAAGGEHAGKLDATMLGGALRTSGLDAAKGPLMTGQLLFGAPSSSPKVSPDARSQVEEYEKSIGASDAAEKKARALTGHQVRRDQGSTAMDIPDFTGPMRPYRTPFFNGYWQREQTNPQPTAQSTTGKSVRFDASADQLPDAQRDPGRKFAIKQAQHHQAKQVRRAKIDADIEGFKSAMAPSWAKAGEAGAATHKHERRIPFKAAPPVEVLQQKLIEEE